MTRKTVIFFVLLFSICFMTPVKSLADFDCLTLKSSSSQTDKDFCRAELSKIEAELQELLVKQQTQKKETGTLSKDVNSLKSKISGLQKQISGRAKTIAILKVDIKDKVTKIAKLENRIDEQHASLSQLLRNTNDFDNNNFTHLLLSNTTLSDFYSDVESYDSIKQAIQVSVNEIRGVKIETEVAKKDLEVKQDKETDAKAELESAKKKTAQAEAEKKKLLSLSKKQEEEYHKLALEKKAKADKIRSALFSLAGISQKIEFGTALKYANEAKAKTGIDPAFLLAILKQESNLGSNVGKCYLSDLTSGSGINRDSGKVWTNVMKPTRDLSPFIEITSKLNLNPLDTAVSCPIAGVAGYGGAMGPAQFIPSTWKIFESRLKNVLGYEASPWAPRDAFLASAMYLTDLGAVGNSASAQNKAACRYYGSGGSSCSYSRSVMKLKSSLQDDIDLLSS